MSARRRFNVIFCLIFILFVTCKEDTLESIVLVPNGYIGTIIIVFGQEDGIPAEVEKGKHVYRVPMDGLLKTKVNFNRMISSLEYYYVDSLGKRTALEYLYPDHLENLGDTKQTEYNNYDNVYVTLDEMGSTPVNKPDFKKYRSFVVGPFSKLDSLVEQKSTIVLSRLIYPTGK